MMKSFYILVTDAADRAEGGIDYVSVVSEEVVASDDTNEASEIQPVHLHDSLGLGFVLAGVEELGLSCFRIGVPE